MLNNVGSHARHDAGVVPPSLTRVFRPDGFSDTCKVPDGNKCAVISFGCDLSRVLHAGSILRRGDDKLVVECSSLHKQ